MRLPFLKTSLHITIIYSILFTFPMVYIPVAHTEDIAKKQFAEDLLRCKGPKTAVPAGQENLPYLLKESGCIPDNVTPIAKLMFAIRLLDDDYLTKIRYNNPNANFSEPSPEWKRAYSLVRDVERLYQDDHERRIPEYTLRSIRAAGNLIERFYDRTWWNQQCNLLEFGTARFTDCMRRFTSFGNALAGEGQWQTPGLIPRVILYSVITQLRYTINMSSRNDKKALIGLAKSYLAPGIDPKDVILHFPEDREAYDASSYRLKWALISQYEVQSGKMKGEESSGIGGFFNRGATAEQSGFKDLDMALEEIDAGGIGERTLRGMKKILAMGLGLLSSKELDNATLEEACRKDPNRCRVGTPTPTTGVAPARASDEDPRRPIEVAMEESAHKFGDILKEKLATLYETLQERRESAAETAEANQFINMSLLIQSIADPMSAYTDPMIRDFVSKFKIEFPAAKIPVKTAEEGKALLLQYQEMMTNYGSEIRSSAESAITLGGKKNTLTVDSDDEDSKNKLTLSQIIIKDKRLFRFNETVSTKFYRRISSNGEQVVVNLLVGTDRFLSNPWFSVEALRYVMNGAVSLARDRDALFKAFTTPLGSGLWNGIKQISIRFLSITTRTALGGMADIADGGIGNRAAVPPQAGSIAVIANGVNAVDNLATTTPHLKSFTDKMVGWSRQGFIPLETKIGKYSINTELNFKSVLTFLFVLQSVKAVMSFASVMATTSSTSARWSSAMRSVSKIIHARLYIPGKIGLDGLKNFTHNMWQILKFPVTKELTGLRETVADSVFWRRLSKGVFWWDIFAKVHNNFKPEEPIPNTGDLLFNVFGHLVVDAMTKGWRGATHGAEGGAVGRFAAEVLRMEDIVGIRHTKDLSKCGEKDIIDLNQYFTDNVLETYHIANICEIWKDFRATMDTTAVKLQDPKATDMDKMKIAEDGRMSIEILNDRIKSIALGMIRVHYAISLSNFNSTQPALASRLQFYSKSMDGLNLAMDRFYKSNKNFQIVDQAIKAAKIPVIMEDSEKEKAKAGEKDSVDLAPETLKDLDKLLEKTSNN